MSEYIINDEQIAENRRLHGRMLLVLQTIVRCRDCKHYDDGMCYLPDGDGDYARWEVEPDGFCAWGEGK